MTRVVLAFTVLVTLVLAGFASPAGAHAGDEAYAYLDVTESTLGGRIDIPVPDLEEVTGLALDTADGDIETLMANVAANRDVIDAYLFEHFSVGANGVSWPLTYEEAEPLSEGDSTALYVLFPFTADVPVDEVPRVLRALSQRDGAEAALTAGEKALQYTAKDAHLEVMVELCASADQADRAEPWRNELEQRKAKAPKPEPSKRG